MNQAQQRDAASFLNADEASAIETAVRMAVSSILKVFCALNDKRSHCYEAKLAEAERENAALRIQLKAAEQELQTLRQISTNYTVSAQVTLNHHFSTDVPQERPEEPPESPGQSQGSLVIKEEPLCIKSEMADESLAAECDCPVMDNVQNCQQTPSAQTWSVQHPQTFNLAQSSLNQTSEKWVSGDVLTERLKSRECVRRYRERIRADPEKYLAWKERERLRYQQKRKTINDLSEPLKKLKRKAWREAKRRDRARKQVKLCNDRKSVMAGNTKKRDLDLLACNEKNHSRSLRRRKRIQDLPEAMQKLQRKAWREATRRHRARKMAQSALAATNMPQTLNP